MPEQRRVQFFGTVQGVGFRWTTQRIAGGHDVTGWVRNCADGSVEVVTEGEDEEIDRFLEALHQRLGHFIRDEKAQSGPASGQFTGFQIRA